MALSFPHVFPSTIGLRNFDLRMRNIAGRSVSPFSLAEQVYDWGGEAWEASGSWPPILDGATEAEIRAFLVAQRSGSGTFVMGDPKRAALLGIGPGSAAADFPTIDATHAAALSTIATRGWGASRSGILKRGDMLQMAKNYLTQPKAIDHADWTKNEGTITSTAQTDPDGGSTADRLTPSVGATDCYVLQAAAGMSVVASRVFYFSVWVKAASGTPVASVLVANQGNTPRGSATPTLTTSWQRVTVTGTMISTDTGVRVIVGQGAEADGPIDIWGATLYSLEQDARLISVCNAANVDSDAAGDASLEIWPRLRASTPDFSPVIHASPKGSWRLAPGFVPERTLGLAKIAGLGFEAVEAINL
jgi:hypothetical protein